MSVLFLDCPTKKFSFKSVEALTSLGSDIILVLVDIPKSYPVTNNFTRFLRKYRGLMVQGLYYLNLSKKTVGLSYTIGTVQRGFHVCGSAVPVTVEIHILV